MPFKDPERRRESARQAQARYRAAHPEQERLRQQIYRQNNVEKRKDNHQKWVANNPERNRANKKKWNENHRDRVLMGLRKRKCGVSYEEQVLMYDRQLGLCAICGVGVDFQKAHLDHDHATGKCRDFLCRTCNLLLGHACDDTKVLLSAVAYLQKHADLCSITNRGSCGA